jgi:hypothetical protein
MANMAISIARIGPDKAIENYADSTDRIAAGELPFAKPERPQGIERNVVISMWDWGLKGEYLHDAIASEKYGQKINANGPIYGSPEESSDMVPVLDPKTNTFSTLTPISIPRQRRPRPTLLARRSTGATNPYGTATPASTIR